MGGHGALTLYLKNPTLFKSVSAFSPICNPTKCPWGEKAFKGYLANGVEEGKQHDATESLGEVTENGKRKLSVLIDCGTGDDFYKQGQLLPENFVKKAESLGYGKDSVELRLQDDYDHSCECLDSRESLQVFPFDLVS